MPKYFTFILFLLEVIIARASYAGVEDVGDLPPDQQLRAIFVEKAADFDALITMLLQDEHLWRIGFDLAYVKTPLGTPPKAPTQEELPTWRWDEYQRLFRALGLVNGSISEQQGNTEAIYLPAMIAPRGAVDSEEKGFVYWVGSPEPLLESLDEVELPVPHAQPAYALLRGDWYLYRRYNE